jgi:hypothetical protein
MSSITIPLITIIIVTLLWLWLLRQIFDHSDKKKFFLTSMISVISVIIITIIYSISHTFQFNYYTTIIIYSSIILIGWCIYIQPQRLGWRVSQSIAWIIIACIWWTTWTYSIAALGEESMKWIYIKKFISWLIGEIILLGIVSGIVFGRTENIVYTVQYIINNATKNEILILIQQRGILPIIVHIWSMCISLLIWFHLKWKTASILARSIAIASGVTSHFLFNISQYYNIPIWSAIIILWYLVVMSYSLFRSDLLYIINKNDS